MSVMELEAAPTSTKRVAPAKRGGRRGGVHRWCLRCAEEGNRAEGRVTRLAGLIARTFGGSTTARKPCRVCELCAAYESDALGF